MAQANATSPCGSMVAAARSRDTRMRSDIDWPVERCARSPVGVPVRGRAGTACPVLAPLRHADCIEQCPRLRQGGKYMLVLSSSQFDPERDIGNGPGMFVPDAAIFAAAE